MEFTQRYRYNVHTDLIGKGGFARVYKAHDTMLNRDVAIKVFHVSNDSRGSVLAEIRRASRCDHPNLVKYHDVVLLENTNAFGEVEKMEIGVMEYANGGDLKQFIRHNKDMRLLAKLLVDVLTGLQYLHAQGIVHRDLKPQNILLHRKDGQLVAKITDFGISKHLENEAAVSSALVGAVEYMAPEQFKQEYRINGRIATNLDLWSFGVMLFELLTGQHPFGQRGGGTTPEQIMGRILSPELPPEVNKLAEPYRQIVKLCLVADAKKRIRNSQQLIDLLQESDPRPLPPKPNRAKAIGWLMSLVLGLVLVYVVYLRPARPQSPSYSAAQRLLAISPAQGRAALRQAASSGNDSASFELARLDNKQGHHSAAIRRLTQLAKTNLAGAAQQLGLLYYKGLTTDEASAAAAPDYVRAATFFRQAAEQSRDTAAYYYLSDIYANGRGLAAPDYAAAYKYARLAAEAGSIRGAANLAALYFNGKGVPHRDLNKAFEWYSRAANGGNAYACYVVGYCYAQGIVVQKNPALARDYFTQAASQGVPEAKQALLTASLH